MKKAWPIAFGLLSILVSFAAAQAPATKPPPPASKPAASKPVVARLDGIAAVVNDDVVLISEVEEQLYLFLMRNQQARPDSTAIDTLRSQIVQQLIDEKLIVSEAKRQGVSVSDAEVRKQVDEAVNEAKARIGSAEAFAEQLRRENMTEDKLREKYRSEVQRQMLAQRLVMKQVNRKSVTPAEAEAFFKANRSKFPKAPAEVRVAVVQIAASADSAETEKKRKAIEAIRKRITGGEKFAKVAAEVSEDPGSARAGGDVGFFTHGTMDPVFERAAFSQKIGEVGTPVRSQFGWHVIEVIERDTVKTRAGRDSLDREGKPVIEAHARHILLRTEVSEADVERARKLATRVRDEAVKGTDFATLVRRYSQYQGPQGEGGDLGFLPLTTLQPNIAAGLDTLEVGQVSDVLLNRAGFNVFKLVDRKPEREFTLEEIRAELPDAVAQIQAREKYEEWVKGLRAKAVIKIHKT